MTEKKSIVEAEARAGAEIIIAWIEKIKEDREISISINLDMINEKI